MLTTSHVFLLILVALSGFYDLKERKIPNKITFSGIFVGILFNFITEGWFGLLNGMLGLFAGLAIFFIPFALGGMGAGDVKLMGAIGSLMGWSFSLMTAIYSALVGGIIALGYLLYTGKLKHTLKKMILSLIKLLFIFLNQLGYNERIDRLQQRFVFDGQTYKKIYIPYGVAIAGGAVLVLIATGYGFHIF